jgi:hypothetical protein
MIATTLGLCLSVLPATAPQQPSLLNGDQERVLMTYPLRGLTGVVQAPPALPLWTFLEHSPEPGNTRNKDQLIQAPEFPAQAFSPDVVQDLLREMHRSVLDDEVRMDAQGETLFLAGDSRAVRDVMASLSRIESQLVRDIEIHANLYRWPDTERPPVVVSSDGLRQLVGNKEALWSGRTQTRSGAAAQLGQAQWTYYLGDVNVEVAQKSWITDPDVRLLFEGIQLVVQPHALLGGDDIALFCQYAFGEQQSMDTRYTGQKEFPALDVPEVYLDAGLASARISNGGAMVCSFRSAEGAGSQMLLVISASQESPGQDQPDNFKALPVSALISSTRSNFPRNAAVDRIGEDHDIFRGNATWGRIIDLGPLMDLIRDNVNPNVWDESASINAARGILLVQGDSTTLTQVQGLLLQLQDRWLRNTEVEIRTVLDPATTRSGPFAEVSGTGQGERVLHRMTYPALTGRTHFAVHGVETLDLRDIDVEISQDASVANPVVETVFSGVYAGLLPYRGSDGLGVRAEVHLVQVKELQAKATRSKDGGDLYLPSTGISRFAHAGPVGSGQTIDMGTGPLVSMDNQTFRTRQQMRIVLR